MPRKSPRPGRRPLSRYGSVSLTVKFERPQVRLLDKFAGPQPGARPAAIRRLVAEGLKRARI